ncbi:MAG: protein kinase [Pirellulaceae bacterium]
MNDDSILADYLDVLEESQQSGKEITPEQFCADRPELLEQLKRQIQAVQAIDRRLKTRATGGSTTNLFAGGEAEDAPDELTATSALDNLRFHAHGGMGRLYKAHDTELHRDVAVKFLDSRLADNEEIRQRFLLEAEVTGRLDHPGIVPVYGMGRTDDGRLFYLMRFIEGESLDALIEQLHAKSGQLRQAEWNLEYRRLLNHFVSVCKTVAYAHNRGIIHRDVKPRNIMLGRYGETIVIDWGLTMSVERGDDFKVSKIQTLLPQSSGSGAGSSATGAGTPGYMSPEQFDPDAELGPATDIYSLGVTLYEILAGENPYKGMGLREVRAQIERGRVTPPSALSKFVSPAVEAICLKAMAHDPGDRYGTASELAADVERYLSDEAVSAYREPVSRRAARWARRHRGGAAGLGLGLGGILLAAVVTAVVLLFVTADAKKNEQQAVQAKEAAVEARDETLRLLAEKSAWLMVYAMEKRFDVLQQAAGSSELRAELQKIDDAARQEGQVPEAVWQESADAIQAWLYKNEDRSLKAANWFVNDVQGVQVARVEEGNTIGKNFAWRDYFNGLQEDLPEGETAEPMTDAFRLATIVHSHAGDGYKAMFSVPVRSEDGGKVIGILGMGVVLGEFDVLKSASNEHLITLVDMRSYSFAREDQTGQSVAVSGRGLILHHPTNKYGDADGSPARVPQDVAQRMERVLLGIEPGARPAAQMLQQYHDPVADEGASAVRAAFAPVVYNDWLTTEDRETRNLLRKNLGWFVLVHERAVGGQ